MYEDPTPEVLAHLRRTCDHLELAAIALPEEIIERLLVTAGEMLGLVPDPDDDCLPVVRLPLPGIQGILDALLDARAHECRVSASDVAGVIWNGEHGHSELCRLGQRLRLMSAFGMVVRHAPRVDSGRANRWSLVARA